MPSLREKRDAQHGTRQFISDSVVGAAKKVIVVTIRIQSSQLYS